jgi:phenylalanyl-tRNA synthetase beta chain
MKFSVNWLAVLAGGVEIAPKQLGNLITLKTAEQEGVEEIGAHLSCVVAARVVDVQPIEGSKNVKAIVDAGPRHGRKQVVCGAPNCRAEIVTAYVPTGCAIERRQIEKTRISGVESDGMLASGAELGINRDEAGILELTGVDPGAPIPGCLPDAIIDIDNKSLTHRPDLWGHHGMAREVAAIIGSKLVEPVNTGRLPQGAPAIAVEIEDYGLCPRYSALVFENTTVKPSPLWLQYRLESIGLNPINNIVDVTNYVMAEIAQPMHAFDRDKLVGNTIYVRRAKAGEQVEALNKESYSLDERDLVIADVAGAVAVAGVIGGMPSGVTESTTRVVLESANFHAAAIRKTSSRLKVRTDASMRFEKAQDPINTVRGLARAIELLEDVSPGIRLVGGLIDNWRRPADPPEIQLPLNWLRSKLGRDISAAEVRAILEALEFSVRELSGDVLLVKVPSWRATKDVSIKDDLVEEVGRMIGYDSIAPVAPLVPAAPPPPNPERDYHHKVLDLCTSQGFNEVYNYSFLSQEQAAEIGIDPASHVGVLNPISSEQGLLRSTLVAGILRNVRDNSRHLEQFRLFEIGYEIHRDPGSELPRQAAHLAAALYAREGDGVAGLLEIKRLAECLLPGVEVGPADARQWEHPVRSYGLVWRDTMVGRIGEFHPRLVEQGRAALLDIDLDAAFTMGVETRRYKPLRKFPTSAFDLSVIAGEHEHVGEIGRKLSGQGIAYVLDVAYVRQYQGPPLPEGAKSVSFRVTVGADDRTLPAQEIGEVRAKLIATMKEAGYELRI